MSNATSLVSLFDGAARFNQPLDRWNVSKVSSLWFTFFGATSFDQNISGWQTGNVVSLNTCFALASSFNQDLSSWNVQSAESFNNMFREASSFNQDLNIWGSLYVGNRIVDTSGMFHMTACPVTTDPQLYGSYCHCNPDLTRRQCRHAESLSGHSATYSVWQVLLTSMAVAVGGLF